MSSRVILPALMLVVALVVDPHATVNAVADASRPATTLRVSVSSDGSQSSNVAYCGGISSDAGLTTMLSGADNLVPGDTNGVDDVFVHDMVGGSTIRANLSSTGAQANDQTLSSGIASTGRYVVFDSNASNLAPDSNPWTDVFVHDMVTGTTKLADVSSSGVQANDAAWDGHLSSAGRFVVFTSPASNLSGAGGNGSPQIYLRDRKRLTTELISVSSGGLMANDWSISPAVSSDGRYIAFESKADNLVQGDSNHTWDVFVRDRVAHTTQRISVSTEGHQGNGASVSPAISGDGTTVAFGSYARNLVAGDTNGVPDGFVHSLASGVTERFTLSSTGTQADGPSGGGNFSPDGRFLAFFSDADDLVPADTNGSTDAFVRDLATGAVQRVSLSARGDEANGWSIPCGLSRGGRYVAFSSGASDLVLGDTNGVDDSFERGPLGS